jgi:hypothetical protein
VCEQAIVLPQCPCHLSPTCFPLHRRITPRAAFGTDEQRLLQAIYTAMDIGSDGCVTFAQFATALSTIYRGDKDDILAFWFSM